MTVTEMWIGIIGSLATTFAVLAALFRHMIRTYLHELIPNHGSSMKDKVNHLEQRVDDIYKILLEKK
jgi:hypothetical protein